MCVIVFISTSHISQYAWEALRGSPTFPEGWSSFNKAPPLFKDGWAETSFVVNETSNWNQSAGVGGSNNMCSWQSWSISQQVKLIDYLQAVMHRGAGSDRPTAECILLLCSNIKVKWSTPSRVQLYRHSTDWLINSATYWVFTAAGRCVLYNWACEFTVMKQHMS